MDAKTCEQLRDALEDKRFGQKEFQELSKKFRKTRELQNLSVLFHKMAEDDERHANSVEAVVNKFCLVEQ